MSSYVVFTTTYIIETRDARPICVPHYRQGPKKDKIIEQTVKEYLKDEIIFQSKSTWRSTPEVVPKSEWKNSICINFKALNEITKSDKYPLPNISKIFVILYGSKCISKLELKSRLYQVFMDESSIIKTAFATKNRHHTAKPQIAKPPYKLLQN